ncbi:MAG: helix-turn-helix domain-containing protein [candidate division WOR-3 bacterium]
MLYGTGDFSLFWMKCQARNSAVEQYSSCELLTAEQVAEITGESKKTVWKRVARGELPHLKIGRLDRFGLEEINTWLEQMGPKPGTQKTGVFLV